ncbi:MAG: hypothetical protein KC493_11115 [Bacteriovoracaceae bacterium]|nr:hypothetical protein [Bacteriovoracaceae bacterium]
MKHNKIIKILIFVATLTFSIKSFSYETDQYSPMFVNLSESSNKLDHLVNEGIETVVRNWKGPRSDIQISLKIADIFQHRQLEKWVNQSGKIDTWSKMSESIFRTVLWRNSPIIRFKGMAASFKLNDVIVGADKMSHFFGVGREYFRKYSIEYSKKDDDKKLQKILDWGAFSEKAWWGKLTTNVFSNADLVVNYEGFLFLKSLTEDFVIDRKLAIIKWVGDIPYVQRKFKFSDHVTDFWSEALLPSLFQVSVKSRVLGVLRKYCTRKGFVDNPERFKPRNEVLLMDKYKNLSMELDIDTFRLDKVCEDFSSWSKEEKDKFLKKQTRLENRLSDRFNDGPVIIPTSPLEFLKKYRSSIPGCYKDIKNSLREYQLLSVWKEELSKTTISLLDKFSQYSTTDFNYDELIEVDELETQFSIDQKNETDKRSICVKSKFPFVFRKNTSISLSTCRTYKGDIYSESSQYLMKRGGFDLYSLAGYYELDDMEGYVYRAIPYHCKWY